MTSLTKSRGELVATGITVQAVATMMRRRWNLMTRFWPEVALCLRPRTDPAKRDEQPPSARPN